MALSPNKNVSANRKTKFYYYFENLSKRQREETRTNAEQYNQYEAKTSENDANYEGGSKLSFDQWLENKKKNEKTLNRLIKKMQKDEMKKTEDKNKRNLTYEDWMVKKEEDELNKWRKARDEARRRRAEVEKEQKIKEQLKKTEELEKQKKEEEMKMKEEELKQLQEDQKTLLNKQASEIQEPPAKIQEEPKPSSNEEPISDEQNEEVSSVHEVNEISEKSQNSESEEIPEPEIIVKIESEITVPGAPIPRELVKGEEFLLVEKEAIVDNLENTETVTENPSQSDQPEPKSEPVVQELKVTPKIESSNENLIEKVEEKTDPKVEPKVVQQTEEDSKSKENNLREKSNLGQFIPHEDKIQKEVLPSRNVFDTQTNDMVMESCPNLFPRPPNSESFIESKIRYIDPADSEFKPFVSDDEEYDWSDHSSLHSDLEDAELLKLIDHLDSD